MIPLHCFNISACDFFPDFVCSSPWFGRGKNMACSGRFALWRSEAVSDVLCNIIQNGSAEAGRATYAKYSIYQHRVMCLQRRISKQKRTRECEGS